MIKKTLITFVMCLFLISNSYSAGSGGDGGDSGGTSKVKTDYDKAVSHIKVAKKQEKKGKLEKAKNRYQKAQKLLLKSNIKSPNKADTLNYLGFTTRKLGDYQAAERYYLEGLSLKPNHIGINEYLGELYVATNRHNLAVERLQILESCKCEEYNQLKAIIAGEKVSKY